MNHDHSNHEKPRTNNSRYSKNYYLFTLFFCENAIKNAVLFISEIYMQISLKKTLPQKITVKPSFIHFQIFDPK